MNGTADRPPAGDRLLECSSSSEDELTAAGRGQLVVHKEEGRNKSQGAIEQFDSTATCTLSDNAKSHGEEGKRAAEKSPHPAWSKNGS